MNQNQRVGHFSTSSLRIIKKDEKDTDNGKQNTIDNIETKKKRIRRKIRLNLNLKMERRERWSCLFD